jgi:hypothetical protein
MLFATFLALVCVCVFNMVLIVVMTRPRHPGESAEDADNEEGEPEVYGMPAFGQAAQPRWRR